MIQCYYRREPKLNEINLHRVAKSVSFFVKLQYELVTLPTNSFLLFSRKFAEAVARKLMFAQQVLKDQNCNFSTFENSGEDLINEVSVILFQFGKSQCASFARYLHVFSSHIFFVF